MDDKIKGFVLRQKNDRTLRLTITSTPLDLVKMKRRKREIDLEDMDEALEDPEQIASAIDAALHDAQEAISASREEEKKAREQVEFEEETVVEEEPEIESREAVAEEPEPPEAESVEEEPVVFDPDEFEPAEADTEKAEPGEHLAAEIKTTEAQGEKSEKPMGLADLAEQPEEELSALPEDRKKEDDYYELYLRQMADFENYKKRVVKDKEEFKRFANEDLIVQFLPVIDNFERAIAHGEESRDIKALIAGVKMIHRQYIEALRKSGLRSFNSVGKPFDPTKHQAMQTIETDEYEPNTVTQEFQKGYFLHERLIRPALVVVSLNPKEEKIEESGKAVTDENGEKMEEALNPSGDDEGELDELEPISED